MPEDQSGFTSRASPSFSMMVNWLPVFLALSFIESRAFASIIATVLTTVPFERALEMMRRVSPCIFFSVWTSSSGKSAR